MGSAVRPAADTSQTVTSVCVWDSAQNKMVSVPIDMGLGTDKVTLVIYGTGFRGRTSLVNVSATVGGQSVVVDYASAQGGFVGLDQLNLELPRSLRGMGSVAISLTVDGKTANTLNVAIAP